MAGGRRWAGRRSALGMVVVLAALVRVCGIAFGLPHTLARPDEARVISMALDVVAGDPRPPHFRYPGLYVYSLAGVFALDRELRVALGSAVPPIAFPAKTVDLPAHFLLVAVEDPGRYFLLARVLTALLGALTVVPVYRMAARMAGHRAGMAAAVLLALTHLHARDSHFATTDVPMTFFIAWAMALAVEIPRTGALRHYALAGLFAGLATSTKYAGVFVTLPVLIGHLARARRERLSLARLAIDWRPLAFAACLLAAFALGTPFAVAEPRRLVADVALEAQHLAAGHGVPLGTGFWQHASFSLLHGLGWPQLLAAAAGAALMLRRHRRVALALLAFPLAYYLAIGRGHTVFLRYALPLVPFACVASGVAVSWMAGRLAGLVRAGPGAVAAVLLAAVVAPSARSVMETDLLLRRTDTRVLAARWIERDVPAPASLFQTGSPFGQVERRLSREAFRAMYPTHEAGRRALRILDRHGGRGYDAWELDRAGGFVVNGRRAEGLPDFVVVQESPLERYSEVPAAVRSLVAARYTRRVTFPGVDPSAPRGWFDQQDAFFLPFVHPASAPRPGPTLHVYELSGRQADGRGRGP